MSSPTSTAASQPWLYFLAGALLPTLAYYIMGPSSMKKKKPKNDDSEYDDDDSANESVDEDLFGIQTTGPSSKWGMMNAPYKLVLVVNMELKMGKGKIAAQVGHAAVGCYKRASRQCPSAVAAWERTGCAKIAVKCPTQTEMESLCEQALALDIPLYLVEDAGRTQIAAGSRTVLGLGPAPVAVFEGLTSHLKLM